MATSSDPDDHDGLSSWERRVLADIEDDLTATDPRFAQEIVRSLSLPPPRWWPLSMRCMVLLPVVLLVLVVASVLVPASSWAVLGLITTVVVVPWLVLCVSERRGPDRVPPGSPKRGK